MGRASIKNGRIEFLGKVISAAIFSSAEIVTHDDEQTVYNAVEVNNSTGKGGGIPIPVIVVIKEGNVLIKYMDGNTVTVVY